MSRFLAFVVLFSFFGGSAWATPEDDAGQRAEMHSKRGVNFYRQGKLADAVREMLQAYKAVPDPALLFNIARIYEKLGEAEIAIGYYQKFVTSDDAEPVRVQKAIEYMQALREKAKAAAIAPPPIPPPPAPVAPPATPAPHSSPTPAEPAPSVASEPAMSATVEAATAGDSNRWLGPTLLGTAGVGVLVGGLVYAAQAKQAEKDIENYGLPYEQRLEAQSNGRDDTLTADVLMLTGGVSLAGALVWYSLSGDDVPPTKARPGLVAGAHSGGWFVGLSGVLP